MQSLPKITSSATSATEQIERRGLLSGAAAWLALASVLGGAPQAAAQQPHPPESAPRPGDPALVHVHIVKTSTPRTGPGQNVEINGRVIPNYHPTIIETFPATGVVLDEAGHVLTFLGYRWVELHGGELRIEIVDPASASQAKIAGKLVGIDQSTGVAVLRAAERGLRATQLCAGCALRGGTTVVVALVDGNASARLEEARVVAVSEQGGGASAGWQVRIDRPLQGVGAPLLDPEHRVLGFVAAQKISSRDQVVVQTIVYPISQLLTSASKIIQAGGDIQTGWLGVYVDDMGDGTAEAGVRISGVVAGGPAALAGLEPDDVVVRWNRSPIRDALEFIRLVQETNPGTSVDLGLVRAGKQRRLQAVVATRRPDESRGVLVVTFPDVLSFPDSSVQAELSYAAPRDQRPGIGVDLYPLTPQLAGVLEIPGQAGLLVSSVQPNAPAALAGVRAGDVILSIDGRRIFDPLAFMAHIQARGWGSTLVLRYLRKKTEHVARIYLKRALGGR